MACNSEAIDECKIYHLGFPMFYIFHRLVQLRGLCCMHMDEICILPLQCSNSASICVQYEIWKVALGGGGGGGND